jgi:hypothetical protein
MISRNESYKVVVAIAVLSGVSGLIIGSANPFAFASSAATTTANQTGNQTGANMTTTAGGGGGDQETANKQLDQGLRIWG